MTPRDAALEIWRAGVAAVRAETLVQGCVRRTGDVLDVCGRSLELPAPRRLAVVGAGKAGAGMALGLEAALGEWPEPHRRSGWVNVPADCVRPTRWIHLHAGRPAGINAPTAEGVTGTERLLDLVRGLEPEDLCLVLLSGGGSALLPAPVAGLSLAHKQAVTQRLSEAGASIDELNCVRRALSRIKGGGLLRQCRAGTIWALVISDVVGDPLETIASGPLVPNPTTPADALAVLQRLVPDRDSLPPKIWQVLESRAHEPPASSGSAATSSPAGGLPPRVEHFVIGNNRTACEAAAAAARQLGYNVVALRPNERGVARDVGVRLAREARQRRDTLLDGRPVCLITGGEPVVQLTPCATPRSGGRNQELVLAAAQELWSDGLREITLLSGGTDGEDGPTDAAGACIDADVLLEARRQRLDPDEFLRCNNSYPFFAAAGGLIRTGPTHTNVMDLRVVLIGGAPHGES